jgi:uncharacterized OB-fold protein
MSDLTPEEPYLRPLPRKEAFNMPLWEGLQRHEFLVPKCNACGDWNWIPYPACRTCLSEDQSWTPVSGEGRLMTFSVVHRAPPTFGRDPYIVALVELKERPRSLVVLGNVVDTAPDRLEIGMAMKIVYEDIPGEDITLWRFKAG